MGSASKQHTESPPIQKIALNEKSRKRLVVCSAIAECICLLLIFATPERFTKAEFKLLIFLALGFMAVLVLHRLRRDGLIRKMASFEMIASIVLLMLFAAILIQNLVST
jgi:predicted membrane channel-forming protein YqfA (hemolysin III family)